MSTPHAHTQPLLKRSHAWIDARSLALAEAVAEKVRSDPALLQRAVENLTRWKRLKGTLPPCLREWEDILAGRGLEDALAVLVEESEEGRRRRQSSPFTGLLTPAERKEIFQRYEAIGA